jgi:RNA polymerase sigma-70 factor (ECF subfamily)
VRRGDAAAFEVLVRRHTPRALTVARRLLGDPDDAEDLVQDAFIRVLDKIHTFDAEREFAPWFFRLLVNLGINARKSKARRRTEPAPPHLSTREPGPDRVVERNEVRERFEEALARLPDRQRLVVSLYDVDGMTSAEIAKMLRVSQETVRWHLHQARVALRASLAPLHD